MISATIFLLCRVLVTEARKTCKAASGGATRLCDRSIQLRETLSHHRRGSRATDRRSDHYHPISIIPPLFALNFSVKCHQHPWRQRGSGGPPRCWRNTIGVRSSLPSCYNCLFPFFPFCLFLCFPLVLSLVDHLNPTVYTSFIPFYPCDLRSLCSLLEYSLSNIPMYY